MQNSRKQKIEAIKGLLAGKISLSDIKPPSYTTYTVKPLKNDSGGLYKDGQQISPEEVAEIRADKNSPYRVFVNIICKDVVLSLPDNGRDLIK
jgi:hypothetical protein